MGTTIDPALATDTISGNNTDDDVSKQIGPPPTHAPTQGPVMATLQPSHPDQYRALPSLPPPQQMYAPQYPAPQMGYPQAQPAPRQRTAIACRYCRRRKVRTASLFLFFLFDIFSTTPLTIPRFDARGSISQKTVAAPTVNAFHKSASSLLSARRPRHLCRPTPSGVVRTHRLTRSCTARTVSHFQLVVATHILHRNSNLDSMGRHLRATSTHSPCTPNHHSKVLRLPRCRLRTPAMLAASVQMTSRTHQHCHRRTRLLRCPIAGLTGSTPTLINLLVRLLSLLPRIPPRTPPHNTIPSKARAPLHLLIPPICSQDPPSEMAVALLLRQSRRSALPLTALCCNLFVVDQIRFHGS